MSRERHRLFPLSENLSKGIIWQITIGFVLVLFFIFSDIHMMDDAFRYQQFAETLVKQGRFEFSLIGFHGVSIIAALTYFLTKSDQAIVLTEMIFAIASVPLLYQVVRHKFGPDAATVSILLYLLIPPIFVETLRGFTTSGLVFFVLLTVYLSDRHSKWTPVSFGYATIIYPFAACLLPLFLDDFIDLRRIPFLILGALIPFGYLVGTYAETGHLLNAYAAGAEAVGAKKSISLLNIWQNKDLLLRRLLGSEALTTPVVLLGGVITVAHADFDEELRILTAVGINILLVMILNWFFPRYLAPMVVLLLIYAAPYFARHSMMVLMAVVAVFPQFYSLSTYYKGRFWLIADPITWIPQEMNPFFLYWSVLILYLVRLLHVQDQSLLCSVAELR